MTLVKAQGCLIYKSRAFEASTRPLSIRSNNDHEDPLGSNKPRPPMALLGPFKAPNRPFQALPPQNPGANQYNQQNLDKIIQTFFHASKSRSRDKLKAKTPNIYGGRSDMECYNFCQQYENHFATYGATGPNRIPFAAFFLCNQVNFRW